jgi:hypothetical protein
MVDNSIEKDKILSETYIRLREEHHYLLDSLNVIYLMNIKNIESF